MSRDYAEVWMEPSPPPLSTFDLSHSNDTHTQCSTRTQVHSQCPTHTLGPTHTQVHTHTQCPTHTLGPTHIQVHTQCPTHTQVHTHTQCPTHTHNETPEPRTQCSCTQQQVTLNGHTKSLPQQHKTHTHTQTHTQNQSWHQQQQQQQQHGFSQFQGHDGGGFGGGGLTPGGHRGHGGHTEGQAPCRGSVAAPRPRFYLRNVSRSKNVVVDDSLLYKGRGGAAELVEGSKVTLDILELRAAVSPGDPCATSYLVELRPLQDVYRRSQSLHLVTHPSWTPNVGSLPHRTEHLHQHHHHPQLNTTTTTTATTTATTATTDRPTTHRRTEPVEHSFDDSDEKSVSHGGRETSEDADGKEKERGRE